MSASIEESILSFLAKKIKSKIKNDELIEFIRISGRKSGKLELHIKYISNAFDIRTILWITEQDVINIQTIKFGINNGMIYDEETIKSLEISVSDTSVTQKVINEIEETIFIIKIDHNYENLEDNDVN